MVKSFSTKDGAPDSSGYGFSRDEMSRLVKTSFDNTTAQDVKNVVIPEIEQHYRGGVEGIAQGLAVDLNNVRGAPLPRISHANAQALRSIG